MITISPKQATPLLLKALKAQLSPFIVGSPGIGKSDIVNAIAEANSLQVIDLRLSQMDPVDLNGLPFPSADGKRMDFIPPAYFPLEGDDLPDGKEGWCLFLDELNSAPLSIQSAAYKLILDRKVGQQYLHKNVLIIAAGNKASDKAITNKMGTALQSRMVHLELHVDVEDWLKWAEKNHIDYRILAYINFKSSALFVFDPNHNDVTFACPRTWAFLSKIIKDEVQLTYDLLPLMAGTISEGAAREFRAFSDIFQDLITLPEILANPAGVSVPQEPSTQYALTSMISEKITEANCDKLMVFISRLPIEFQIILLRQAIARNNKLFKTQGLKKWLSVNSAEIIDD